MVDRPKIFDPHLIYNYCMHIDKESINAEIDYDEAKDQKDEVIDYVINEKIINKSVSVALAKLQATSDDRCKKAKQELSKRKKYHLYCKILAKNGHSYCENLKQKSINYIATEKLAK